MSIFILMNDGTVMRASIDEKKMQEIADRKNDLDYNGPYYVINCLLEDVEWEA